MATNEKKDRGIEDEEENFKDISTNLTVTFLSHQEKPDGLCCEFEDPSDPVKPTIEHQQKVIAHLKEKIQLQKKLYAQKMTKLVKSNLKKDQKIETLRQYLNLAAGQRMIGTSICKSSLGNKRTHISDDYGGNAIHYLAANDIKGQDEISSEIALTEVFHTNEEWPKKFTQFREECSSRILNIEKQFKKKLRNIILKFKKQLESKIQESNRRSDEVVKKLYEAKKINKKLVLKNTELRKSIDDKNKELEIIEERKQVLTLQFANFRLKMKALEGKLTQTEEELKSVTEKSSKAVLLYDRQLSEKQTKLEEQKKILRTQEDMIIGFFNNNDLQDSAHWPKFFKIQAERIARSEKRIIHLETENDLLHEQLKSLMCAMRNLEEELASKEEMFSQLQNRVPDTVALFRDKEALLRELRSQLNHRDLQLLDYSRELDRTRRINKQLESSLCKVSAQTKHHPEQQQDSTEDEA